MISKDFRLTTALRAALSLAVMTCFVMPSSMAFAQDQAAVNQAAGDQVPVPWNGIDIGGPNPAGSSQTAGGAFTLRGGGGTLAGSKDRFHFVYQSVTGDCTLSARVSAGAGMDSGESAGLMVRQALEDGSDFVAAMLAPGVGAASIYRTLYAPQTAAAAAPGNSPLWLKLVKRGDRVQSFMAEDRSGVPGNWKQVSGEQPVPSGMIYVGLYQASGPQGGTAAFDHVSLLTGPQQSFDDGFYTLAPAGAPNMVLVPSGAEVKLAAAADAANQKWSLVSRGGFYALRSPANPALVLTVPGAKTDNGSFVAMTADQGQQTQRWMIRENKNGTYSLVPQFNSGICLDDFMGSGTPAAVIDIWSYDSADPHLQWILSSAQ